MFACRYVCECVSERATGKAENGNMRRIDCIALQAGSWYLELDIKY